MFQVVSKKQKHITMTIPNHWMSNGFAVGITAPATALRIQVVTLTPPRPKAPSVRYKFVWEHCEVNVVLVKQRVGGTKQHPRYQWSFVATDLRTPFFHREHELPLSAAFLLQVHQRLTNAVRHRTVLDLKALYDPA